MFTTSLPFTSRDLAKFGINEDDVVRDSWLSDRFRLSPDKCSFQELSQCRNEAEIHEDVLHCEMCYKPMSQDHQCWKLFRCVSLGLDNAGKVFIFVVIHDFEQHCSLCFVFAKLKVQHCKTRSQPADPTTFNSCFFLPPLPHTQNRTQIFWPCLSLSFAINFT
mgnify:CR=1 FL=1